MDSTAFKKIFLEDVPKNILKDRYKLPRRWDGKDFYATLYKDLKEYRKDVDKYCNDPDLRTDVKTVCGAICAAVDQSFRGYPGNAYEKFKHAMEILRNDPLLIDEKKINEEGLYRVVDVHNAAIPSRQQLFHVPFKMRSKMSTQRYSIPGFPSLYLGTSVELCCMETNKDPHRDFVCVSRYELQTDHRRLKLVRENDQSPVFDNDEFKIFDVSIKPDKAITELCRDDKEIAKYIKWYPLISASSYIRAMRNRDDSYSAEYIIPQLFLQWVRSENEDAVVGIKYFSCAPIYASSRDNNYVFPSMGIPYQARKTITDYCARLSHRFKLTAPKFIMEYESIEDCVSEIKKEIKERNDAFDYIEDYNAGENEVMAG